MKNRHWPMSKGHSDCVRSRFFRIGHLPLAILYLFAPAARAEEKVSGAMAFRVAKVVSMDDRDTVVNDALVLVKSGKIESVASSRDDAGKPRAVPDGYKLFDLPELWLVPGLVDCHDHIAGSLGDLNDMIYQTN